MITAYDIMSDKVIVIYDDMLVSQAAHLMLRDRVSAFPVVNKKIGIVGIITITDLFALVNSKVKESRIGAFYNNLPKLKDLPVKDIMSKNVLTILPKTTLHEIVGIMVKRNIHTFPVMDKGKLVGIVGRHDILNAVFM